MNKAAFLDILHHVSAISDQEVSELEKLALTFPYCQSAHLLLAKAAYDRGSMLSNQKLRRAAACATNRQLLKKLIYTTGADIVLAPIPSPNAKAVALILEGKPEIAEVPAPDEVSETLITAPFAAEAPEPDFTSEAETPDFLAESPIERAEAEENNKAEPKTEIEITPVEATVIPDLLAELDALFSVEQLAPATAFRDLVTDFVIAENAKSVTLPENSTDNEALEEAGLADTKEFVTPPKVETPAATDVSAAVRQNQLLADADSAETLARFDEYLFTPEKEADSVAAGATTLTYQEEILYKVFDANELGYWMDSSRLGETLLMKNELATAQPVHFRPELFLEYSKHHEITSYQPPVPTGLTRQLDIIDQFLKSNPKLKSMAHVKIRTESQEDLSSKSTKIKKNMASETLANILVQQGKIKKAIKIYEHLILKIPEKKAYFVSQIEKLQKLT